MLNRIVALSASAIALALVAALTACQNPPSIEKTQQSQAQTQTNSPPTRNEELANTAVPATLTAPAAHSNEAAKVPAQTTDKSGVPNTSNTSGKSNDAKAKTTRTHEAQLETIVVTANKRVEKLENVPMAIVVVNEQVIQRNNIREIEDIVQPTPALSMNYGRVAAAPVNVVAPQYPAPIPSNTESYQHNERHGIVLASEAPVSTFSIDVDTGSYSNVRRILNEGRLPPNDAVRVEEMVNYFPYDYPLPHRDAPFAVSTELTATPWNSKTLLLRIGVQAADPAKENLPPANLVFLIDVSGSMYPQERLPLLQSALKLLVDQLRPKDRVALVTYAGNTRVALEPTSGENKSVIKAAIDGLTAGGSTAGAAGIDLAYKMAQQGFMKNGINRILLATDGDFNVGITDFETLKSRIAEKRKSGIALSTLGFGTDNYKDKMMEQLADVGDGAYSYIDNIQEAQKVLVHEFTSTLATVANDVKIQLEFNPATVLEYRQIGFENRALKREDFNNDKVDAGDIGAGHRVTALYEITLKGEAGQVDPLRYGAKQLVGAGKGNELGFLRLRFKRSHGAASELVEFPVKRDAIRDTPSTEFTFAAAVAAFGQKLADDGKYLGQFDFAQIKSLAENAKGKDKFGYRSEFINMVKQAENLATVKHDRS